MLPVVSKDARNACFSAVLSCTLPVVCVLTGGLVKGLTSVADGLVKGLCSAVGQF